jgi:hypothetical protein
MSARAIAQLGQTDKPFEYMRVTSQLGQQANFWMVRFKKGYETAQGDSILAYSSGSAGHGETLEILFEDLLDCFVTHSTALL